VIPYDKQNIAKDDIQGDEGLARRRKIAKIYGKAFQQKDFIKGHSGTVDGHPYHLYIYYRNQRWIRIKSGYIKSLRKFIASMETRRYAICRKLLQG
jgi:hypothetical protein